jgi:hypothetical protein
MSSYFETRHNIKAKLRESGWGDKGWIHLVQDMDQWSALVNMVMNLRLPYNVRSFLSR